ncbi:MAG: VanZ family protein [Alphaproteobacteria bacterium]|nr:VanZ family protein [Alphaproteobacteria bacterium]
MSPEVRNTHAPRPDPGLRWAGRVLLLTTLILVTDLALQPGHASRNTLLGPDKLEHIAAFFTLTVLARIGWPLRHWAWAAIAMLSYGVTIEYLQSLDFVGRTASVFDVAANIIGIGFGVAAAELVKRRRWAR